MTKEQEIYRNMKRKGYIFKSHGKWIITHPKLYGSILDAGFSKIQAEKIIENMVNKGYVRLSVNRKGEQLPMNYVIEKWVN